MRLLCENIILDITLLPLKSMHDPLNHCTEYVGDFLIKTISNLINHVLMYVCVGPETLFISDRTYFTTLGGTLLTRNLTNGATASPPHNPC